MSAELSPGMLTAVDGIRLETNDDEEYEGEVTSAATYIMNATFTLPIPSLVPNSGGPVESHEITAQV